MEIVKIMLEWAKDEIFSSKFFVLFGIVFLGAAFVFFRVGKTLTARAFINPLVVCGILLLIIGAGLVYTNYGRFNEFSKATPDTIGSLTVSEKERAEKTLLEYERIVFKVIPLLICCCAGIIVFMEKPIWRASAIVTLAMFAVILLIDTNAYSRMKNYKSQLEILEKQSTSNT